MLQLLDCITMRYMDCYSIPVAVVVVCSYSMVSETTGYTDELLASTLLGLIFPLNVCPLEDDGLDPPWNKYIDDVSL